MFKADKFSQLLTQIFKNQKMELKQSEYLLFWDYYVTDNSDNTLYFIAELIRNIIAIENHKKTSKCISMENLALTLSTVVLFRKINLDKARIILPEIEKEWYNHIESFKKKDKNYCLNTFSLSIISSIFSAINLDIKKKVFSIMGTLFSINPELLTEENFFEENKQKIMNELNEEILRIFFYIKNYNSTIENTILSNFLPDNDSNLAQGENGYCYEGILRLIQISKNPEEKSISNIILDNITKTLKIGIIFITMPNNSGPFNENIQNGIFVNTMITVLHFLKQWLTYFPLFGFEEQSEQQILKELIPQIDIFRKFPFPVGFLANELLNLLFSESKTLGNSYRFKLREEIPQIDFLYYEIKKEDPRPLHTAYCISNEKENFVVSSILNQNNSIFEKSDVIDAHILRVFVIAHVFYCHERDSLPFISHLSGLNDNDVFLIYCRLLNIIDKCEELDSIVDIKNIQQKVIFFLFLNFFIT